MQTFNAKFCRYRNGQNRISRPFPISAEHFREAAAKADLVIAGLEGADPDSRYTIVELAAHGVRGVDCNGIHMFETAEEMTDRHADENPPS